MLAPSLREAASDATGWPVLAVAPDSGVVTREHDRAPYSLSTEIFHIGDTIRAVGSYPG